MTIRETIDQIEVSLGGLFVQEQVEVYKLILKTRNIIFLDTCFITRLIYFGNPEYFSNAFERLAGGKTKEDIVLVITELVLYELKDSQEPVLQKNNYEILKRIKESGFSIVVLRESEVCDNIGNYINRKPLIWNEFLVGKLRDNKANLTYLSRIIMTDKTIGFSNLFEEEFVIPKQKRFINNLIEKVEERKSSRDSLAEELVGVVMFFLFELIKDSNRNIVYFCSNDYAALTRMGKVIQEAYAICNVEYIPLSTFTLAQYMVKEGIIESENWLLELFGHTLSEKITVLVKKEIPYHETEVEITREEAVDLILEGKSLQLRCNKNNSFGLN